MGIISVQLENLLKGTFIGRILRRRKWNRYILDPERINDAIKKNLKDVSAERVDEVRKDIINMARKYRFSADEYFYYHFADKSEQERASFISDQNRVIFCDTVNKFKNLALFDDKIKTAEMFGEHYRREFCGVRSEADKAAFVRFIEKNPKFIVKPIAGSCGFGVEIADLAEREISAEDFATELFDRYNSAGGKGLIAEQLLTCVPEIAQFNPSSLNTVRVATIRFDGGAEVIAAFLRMGRAGSVVDNAGSGGILAAVDVKTGRLFVGVDENGRFYEKHPDSNVEITGYVIPRWDEAVQLVCKLADVVHDNRYAGWDLALTDNGWVMVEGNARGQFVWQISTQEGFLAEANSILRRLGKKEMKKLSM